MAKVAALSGKMPEPRARKMLRDALRFNGATGEQIAQVDDAIDDVRAGGIDFITVLAVIIPIIVSLLSGETLDIEKIIQLILSLLTS